MSFLPGLGNGWVALLFREEGNVGIQDFEKGALNHRNAWPKCTNFLLSSINKLHCLAVRAC